MVGRGRWKGRSDEVWVILWDTNDRRTMIMELGWLGLGRKEMTRRGRRFRERE